MDHTFLPLRIRRHTLVNAHKSQYRVYNKGGDFITIDAASALEAHKNSGFGDAERIVRVTPQLFTSVEYAALGEAKEYVETTLEGPPLIVPMNAPVPEAQAGLKPETVIAAPSRIGADFLSTQKRDDLLSSQAAVVVPVVPATADSRPCRRRIGRLRGSG